MLRFRSRRRSLAFTLVEVLTVSGIMSGMASQGGGTYRYAINAANQMRGISNLRQLHLLLQMQSMGGGLPKAAFYPQGDPKTDPKSIVRLVADAPPEFFVSPFAPDELKRKGLTFAWNDTVNGKDLALLPKDTWLLIDMPAFIADPNMPKPTKYLVLYADGRTEAVDSPPADIVKVVKEAQAKLAASKNEGGAKKK